MMLQSSSLRTFGVVLAGLALLAAPTFAKQAPQPNNAASKASPAPLRQIEAVGSVVHEGGAQLMFGIDSGLLREYYLRQPGSAPSKAGSAGSKARDFLVERATVLGLDPRRIDADLRLVSEKSSPSGTHFRWEQVVGGVPVYHSDIVIKVSRLGEVSSVQNNLRPGLSVATAPALDAARAIQVGVDAVQPTGKALAKFQADLRVVDFESGAKLAYLVSVPVEAPLGDWLVFVDAQTGRVLGREDRMVYANGTGRVFDPDPRTKMNDASFIDNNDADSAVPFPASYDTRTLLDITLNAGIYSLSGPYAKILEFESPVVTPVTSADPAGFQFQRNPDGFEDVNVYFHLDQNQRYIQSLGFTNVNNRIQEYDSHGLSGADNSHYVPSTKRLAFGDGGVDDAEDADVVIHEYGHSIQDNIVPGWGGGHEGAMGEGFGDYWAGSYSVSVNPTFEPSFVFNWDGHNAFWPGRVLVDSTLHYPEDAGGEVHDSGTLWCSGLTDCWRRIGRAAMDPIVLDHHFALGTTATMAQAANQVIQSDIDLFGGAHVQTLVTVLGFWGFVNPADFLPTITHTPLTDTENTTGPYPVTATITAAQGLDASSLKVHWGVGAFTDSVPMTPAGPPNQYTGSIPGPLSNVDVRYYIIAKDLNGGTATHPVGAPGSFHQFHVGADVTPPVIVHSPITDFPQVSWPATINCSVTDNLGVNTTSVTVTWAKNSVSQAPITLTRVGLTNNYTGTFTGAVAVSDLIEYHITAQDVANVPNTGRNPSVGEISFHIISVLGRVLILDDDEVAKSATETKTYLNDSKELVTETSKAQGPGDVGASANDMATILNGLGYQALVEAAATSNPANWINYDVLISASGANTSPVANATYRTNIENWVAAGHKLLVEGGEVVFDAASSPGYPTFANNVLHSNDWDADNAGTLNKLAAQASHPIANVPNVLPSSLTIAYTAIGSQDSYKPLAPAFIVYGVTTQVGNGGILVYDPTPPVQSGQIVVFGFDFKDLSTPANRSALLDNTLHYLLASEPAPDGGISGTALLANQLVHSGITITATPGGATTTTNPDGTYSLSGLYPGNYTVTASKAGYAPGTLSNVAVASATTTAGQNFKLYPRPEVQYCVSPGTAIPDNTPAGITSVQNVVEAFSVQDVQVDVNIPHTYIGDLIVELRHGAKTVRLHNRTGGGADNLVGTFPTTLVVDGPGTLANFNGDPSNGTWTLFVSDNANVDTGNLASWCLRLRGPADTTVDTGPGSRMPQVASLGLSEPNPVGEAGTTIRFGLPNTQRTSIAIYDVAGHRVRTLVEGNLPAGFQQVTWDGRDQHGVRVAAGMYLYRLQTGETTLTRKLVVVR
jgi:subtilisin-like proprotein convertase family protein